MGKASQDDLHDLIHCLDPAEKGHFSKYAQRHVLKDGNNYEQLFQLLAKMPEYDAEVVAAELKRLGIATPLAAAKNHLKSIILRAMREYNSGHTTHARLLEGLENLAFLYEKKQYDLLRKELRRLKKIAESYEEHHILFKIGDYERSLHKETARRDIILGMEEILGEMQQCARDFQNTLQFGHLHDKMFVVANKAGADREQAVNALLASELLSAEQNATTLFSRIYYHQIHATALMTKGQNHEAQKKYGAVVSLYENAPHLIDEFPSKYRRILSNYLGICNHTEDYEMFAQILAKVRSSPAVNPLDKAEIFSIGHLAELQWRMQRQDWEGIAALLPSVKAGLETYGPILKQSTVLTFQFDTANYYFLAEDYAACNQWLREITEAPRTEQRMDIQRMAKVLGLLLIWMRRDLDRLEYELRSVTRYFENWGGGVLEQQVLDLMQALLLAQDDAAEARALAAFQQAISAPELEGLWGNPVLLAWAIGIQTGQPLRKVMEELKGQ